MTSIAKVLSGVNRLFIDTAPLIYLIEQHPLYSPIVQEIVRRVDEGILMAYSSVIALTEVLTHPVRLGRTELVEKYRRILLEARNFTLSPIDAATAELAATLRAQHNLRTPDALQVAAASILECDAILTNDTTLKRISQPRVILVDELI